MKKKIFLIIISLIAIFSFQDKVLASDAVCEYNYDVYDEVTLYVYNSAEDNTTLKKRLSYNVSWWNFRNYYSDPMPIEYFGYGKDFKCPDIYVNVVSGFNGMVATRDFIFTTKYKKGYGKISGTLTQYDYSCTYNSADNACTLSVDYFFIDDRVEFNMTRGKCKVSLEASDFVGSNGVFYCVPTDKMVTQVCKDKKGKEKTYFHIAGKNVCDSDDEDTESPNPHPEPPDDDDQNDNKVDYDFSSKCVSCGDDTFKDIPAQLPQFVRNLILTIQLLVPVILIGLGIYDFVRAVISSDEKQMKESQNRFIRRIIASVLIFFVVAIVKFVFSFVPNDTSLGCIPCFISSGNNCSEEYTCSYDIDKEENNNGGNNGGQHGGGGGKR